MAYNKARQKMIDAKRKEKGALTDKDKPKPVIRRVGDSKSPLPSVMAKKKKVKGQLKKGLKKAAEGGLAAKKLLTMKRRASKSSW